MKTLGMLRGIQDFFAQAKLPLQTQELLGTSPISANGNRSKGFQRDVAQDGMEVEPFQDLWKVYCATNPRLRDPRVLPSLMRRGVPDLWRPDVWSHCLGIEEPGADATPTSACSNNGADADALVKHKALGSPKTGTGEDAKDASPGGKHILGGAKQNQSGQEVEELPQSVADVIEADIARTFPGCAAFQGLDGPARLRRVLRTFAASDAELGYCQSLNFVAAILIMVLRDEKAALAAMRQLLVKLGTRSWYTCGMTQLRADTAVLEELLQERVPAVHAVIREHRFDMLFICSKWFLCLFATILEGETLFRVWDVIIVDGIEAIFRVALAILAMSSDAMMKASSCDDLVELLQDLRVDCPPEELIQSAYSPALGGQVSRVELAQRRRQAATRISTNDTRAEMRNTHLRRGGVRPASVLAR